MIRQDLQCRFISWGKWAMGTVGPRPVGISSMYRLGEGAGTDGYYQPGVVREYVPVNEVECDQVNSFVNTLEPYLRETMKWRYVHAQPLSSCAARLGVTLVSVHRRLDLVQRRWDAWIEEKRDIQKRVSRSIKFCA